jgi:perosamine synthetase
MQKIPLFKPSYGKEEIEALKKTFDSGWIGMGPKTEEFENFFCQYVNSSNAIATNCATSALHLGMSLFDVEGMEVITTPMTFVSTNHAILYEKAIPVFCDVEYDTLNIDPNKIERLITSKTKAIVCVDYGGHPCDMDKINHIASKYNLLVLEDAAHSCGAKYKDQPVGCLADITTFSFHAVKNLAAGEGGMITFNFDRWNEILKKRRWLGINKSTYDRNFSGNGYHWSYDVEELGYKYHMSDIAATLGLVQLEKLDQLNLKRRRIVNKYNAELANIHWLEKPVEKEYAYSSNHNYVVKINAKERDIFIEYLLNNGISAGVHYIPNHLYQVYKPYYRSLPVVESVWKKLVSLPLFPDLSDDQFDYIINIIRGFKRE